MILSQNLLSEFAKLTSNNNITKKETIVRGRVVKQNGNYLFNMLDTNSKIPVKIPSGLDLNYPVNAIIKNNSISVIGNVIDPETKLLLSYELKDKLVWTRPYYDSSVKFTSGNGSDNRKKYNSFNMFYKDAYAFKDKIIGNVDDFKINIKFSDTNDTEYNSIELKTLNDLRVFSFFETLHYGNGGFEATLNNNDFITDLGDGPYNKIIVSAGWNEYEQRDDVIMEFSDGQGTVVAYNGGFGIAGTDIQVREIIFNNVLSENDPEEKKVLDFLNYSGNSENGSKYIALYYNDYLAYDGSKKEWTKPLVDKYIYFGNEISYYNLKAFLNYNKDEASEYNKLIKKLIFDNDEIYDFVSEKYLIDDENIKNLLFESDLIDQPIFDFLNINTLKDNIVSSTYKSIDDDFIKNL